MTPAEAAQILDLPSVASAEQVEARYNELRLKLEDKIAKAPTPGLRAKYRESLDEITTAFETLTLAADSSALPVLRREKGEGSGENGRGAEAGGRRPEAGSAGPSPSSLHPAPAPRRKSGSEFVVVALIAVLVLGAGGWWVVKTRAENAERERLAAEAKAQAAAAQAAEQRRIEQARAQAEQDKVAQERAAQAEREKLERLGLQLRSRLTELGIQLDAVLKAETAAERELTEAKAEERAVSRDAKGEQTPDLRAAQAFAQAHERYARWLGEHLAANPVRIARAKLEELAAARAWPDVAREIESYAAGIRDLQAGIAGKRREFLALTGTVRLATQPVAADFELKDAFGRVRRGRTPVEYDDVPLGPVTVNFLRTGWPPRPVAATVARDTVAVLEAEFAGGSLSLASAPFAVDFVVEGMGRAEKGRTPAEFTELPTGDYQVTFARAGWPAQTKPFSIGRGQRTAVQAEFTPGGVLVVDSHPAGAEVVHGGEVLGVTPLRVADFPPGASTIEFRLADHRLHRENVTMVSGGQQKVSAALLPNLTEEEKIIEEFWAKAEGMWKQHGQGGFLTSVNIRMRVRKDERFVTQLQTLSTGDRFDFDGVDLKTRRIRLKHKQRPIGTISMQDDVLQYDGVNGFGNVVTLRYYRLGPAD